MEAEWRSEDEPYRQDGYPNSRSEQVDDWRRTAAAHRLLWEKTVTDASWAATFPFQLASLGIPQLFLAGSRVVAIALVHTRSSS